MLSEEQIELLTRLFQSRYGLVFAIARRYAPSDDLVDDVVQQVYLDFITGVNEKRWDLANDVGPLLGQIAKRKAQLLWRNRRRQENDPFENVLERMLLAYDPDDPGESEQLEREIQGMKRCLEKVPPRSRKIVEQHYFEGMSIKEIAARENKTAGHLRNFLFRIREKLRDCIERVLLNR